jgi:hypothetical protein
MCDPSIRRCRVAGFPITVSKALKGKIEKKPVEKNRIGTDGAIGDIPVETPKEQIGTRAEARDIRLGGESDRLDAAEEHEVV